MFFFPPPLRNCFFKLRGVWAWGEGGRERENAEILTIHRKPLISIFAFRQLDHFPQTSTAERRFGKLLQLPAIGALGTLLGLERGLVAVARVTVSPR